MMMMMIMILTMPPGEDLQQALRPNLHHHRLPRRGGPLARPPRPAAVRRLRGQSIQILIKGKFGHIKFIQIKLKNCLTNITRTTHITS